MTLPATAAPVPPSAPWAAVLARQGGVQTAGRLRLLMHGLLAVVGLAVVALALWTARLEAVRAADAQLIDQTSALRAQAHELAGLAMGMADAEAPATARAALGDELSRQLHAYGDAALALEARLQEQVRQAGQGDDGVEAALTAWHAARERLWYRGQTLANQTEAASADATSVRAAVQALRAEVAPAATAAAALAARVRQAADARTAAHERQLALTAAALLALLVLLALAVVEPVARSLGRRQQRDAEQAAHLRRLALVATNTAALVVVSDAEDRIEWVNPAFEERTGLRLAELRGLDADELLHEIDGDPAGALRLAQARTEGRGLRQEWRLRSAHGRPVWVDMELQPLHDEHGAQVGHVRVASDVTERRALQQALAQHARFDKLTGLLNRQALVQRTQRALDHVQRNPGYAFALLVVDLDRFRQVNDTLGHAAGDELLCQVAERLEAVLRPGDSVARLLARRGQGPADGDSETLDAERAARVGGDQFAAVLDGVTEAGVAAVVERLQDALSQPSLLGQTPVRGSVSIGVALAGGARGGADTDADLLLRQAETALNEAKREGPGRWVLFDPVMRERSVAALLVERDLRRALQDDELFVVYQPVVDLATRQLASVEALVRWRHPERGLVPPLEFIPVAESTGLIDELGQMVLRKACSQFMRWRAELGELAPPLVAVNISRAQLGRDGLVGELRELLEGLQMPPGCLQLEVTESLAAQDAQAQAVLRQLKALGVQLALDDFGTGYSSLACLHQLPVDTVKVDRSFVQHAQTVEVHRVLIDATIRVARTLGMRTVAEGIETEGQAQLMDALRCDRGQGWLFSRPLDAEALSAWARARHAPEPATA